MRIVFFSDNFPPETNAPAIRTFEHCKVWADLGHHVTIVTCFPNFPHGQVFAGYKNSWPKVETFDGLKVIRVPTFLAENKGFALRIVDHFSYLMSSVFFGLFMIGKVDIVIGTTPQFFAGWAGRIFALLRLKKYILEVRDLWPDSIAAVGALSRQSIAFRTLSWLELILYKSSARIVVVTNAFKRTIEKRGVDGRKIHVIYNGVSVKPLTSAPASSHPDAFNVSYIGTIGMAHALKSVIDCAALLKDHTPRINFQFVGDGAERSKLKAYADFLELNNVTWVDRCSHQDVQKHWAQAHVALIHLKNTPLFETVIPSKIFEAMAHGLPIIACAPEGEINEVFRLAGCAQSVIEPENPEVLAKAIKELQSDYPTRPMPYDLSAFDRRANALKLLKVMTP